MLRVGCDKWLGDRDSNPDSMIQSHESYHWTIPQQDRERAATNRRFVAATVADSRSTVPRGSTQNCPIVALPQEDDPLRLPRAVARARLDEVDAGR